MANEFVLEVATPSTANANSYASGSWTPQANRLYLAAVLLTRGSSTDPVTPTVSGNGITWTLPDATEANNLFAPSGTLRYRLLLFRGVSGASPSAGATTVDCGGVTHTGCAIIVAEGDAAVDITAPIVQTDKVAASGASAVAAALAAFEDAGHYTFSCFGADAQDVFTHEGTELADINYATPGATLMAQFLASADTTPGATFPGPDTLGVIAVEVRLAAGGAFELDCQPGSFAVTGADASPVAGRMVNAAAGSYAVTGAAAAPVAGRVISALPGAFTVTGADQTYLRALVLDAAAGSFAITGDAASLLADRLFNVEPGSYTITGVAAELVYSAGAQQFELALDSGVFVVTGADAGTLAGRLLVASPGAYAITGSATGLLAGRLLVASPGSYTLTGAQVGVVSGRNLNAQPGAYTTTGAPAGLTAARLIVASPGGFAITGAEAQLLSSESDMPPVTAHTGVTLGTGRTGAGLVSGRTSAGITGGRTTSA